MYICLYITAEILSPPSWNWFKQLTAISTKKKKILSDMFDASLPRA